MGEDSGSRFVEDVVEGPREKDCQLVAEANEEGEVNEEPGNPGWKACEVDPFGFGDGGVLSNDGHDAFVAVFERDGFFCEKLFRDVLAHLHGCGSEAGDFF